MKKKLMCVVAAVILCGTAMAAPVDVNTAHRVAVTFWNTYRPLDVKPVDTMQHYDFAELQHMYVFANGTEGFVIVAADDRVRPVLGYAFDAPFPTRLHSELSYWLGTYEEQIAFAVTLDNAPANPRWSALMNGEVPPEPVSLQNVSALCRTRWDQGAPYNNMCPYDTIYHERAVVGCVATAMAQIMKYWNHPSCGTGSHSYVHEARGNAAAYGLLEADFENTTYMWEHMPTQMSASANNEKTRAVSTISYHCGVAVDMMYSPQASGAFSSCGYWTDACAENAFRDYFKYSSDLQYYQRNGYDGTPFIPDSVWLAMIDEELANGRPMYYSGSDYSSGHAFILDGSDLDTCYHFNWGWSGYGDGFYAMNNLAPGSGGYGGNSTYTFNLDQGAIFGIQPIPEHFDTVDFYDTTCSNYANYHLYEHAIPTVSCDTLLRHLNTIIRLHLQVITSNTLTLSSGYGGITSESTSQEFCRLDPVVLPECSFVRNGYRFIGWCRSRNGNSEPIYQPGDTLALHENVTFFARWRDSNDVAVPEVEDDAVALWPNPTTGELTIDLGMTHEAQITVLDVMGRSVLRENYPNVMGGSAKISLADLPCGAYTVQIRTALGIYNRRIIKY